LLTIEIFLTRQPGGRDLVDERFIPAAMAQPIMRCKPVRQHHFPCLVSPCNAWRWRLSRLVEDIGHAPVRGQHVVVVDEEIPLADLDPDRGKGVLPAAARTERLARFEAADRTPPPHRTFASQAINSPSFFTSL
jgi:hypothetical protein